MECNWLYELTHSKTLSINLRYINIYYQRGVDTTYVHWQNIPEKSLVNFSLHIHFTQIILHSHENSIITVPLT